MWGGWGRYWGAGWCCRADLVGCLFAHAVVVGVIGPSHTLQAAAGALDPAVHIAL